MRPGGQGPGWPDSSRPLQTLAKPAGQLKLRRRTQAVDVVLAFLGETDLPSTTAATSRD
jgi:hypothetical protein